MAAAPAIETVKCIILGDYATGKTCLGIRLFQNELPGEYIPRRFDPITVRRTVDDIELDLTLEDTPYNGGNGDDYPAMRLLSYPGQDLFLLCYAAHRRDNFRRIGEYWLPEVRAHTPKARWVLVMLKSDLRDDISRREEANQKGEPVVTEDEARAFAKQAQAEAFIMCSAVTGDGIDEIVPKLVRIVRNNRKNPDARPGDGEKGEKEKKKKDCTVM